MSGKRKKLMIGIGIFAVLCAIVVICVAMVANTPEKRFRKKMDLGKKYLENMDYEKAVVSYLAAIEINPNHAEAYVGLAKAYLGMGKEDKARKAYQTALEKQTDYKGEYPELDNLLSADAGEASEDGGAGESDGHRLDEQTQGTGENETDEGQSEEALKSSPGPFRYVYQGTRGSTAFWSEDGRNSHLEYYSESGDPVISLEFTIDVDGKWNNGEQLEFDVTAVDVNDTGEYVLLIAFLEEREKVVISGLSISGNDMSPWDGKDSGVFMTEYLAE